MSEEKFLHLGDMKPAHAVYDGEDERQPGQAEGEAELDDAALADDVERGLEIEAVALPLFGDDLAVDDGQEKCKKDGNE